jgi:RHS repeat-associated protein
VEKVQWIDQKFHAIVTDLVGTPTELVGADGKVTTTPRTSVWGARLPGRHSGPSCPLHFPGQYHDQETGLSYNYHRYYDPGTAGYGSSDPIGLEGGLNPYRYVSNPFTSLDPLGLSECLGLRPEAQRAIEKLENVKRDPLGEINSKAGHNHYSAARREAAGEVVARKADGTPFSHISDVQQARDSLKNNIIPALRREMDNPPDSITSRGIDVLDSKYQEAVQLQKRTDNFLASIGQYSSPPYHRFPPGA